LNAGPAESLFEKPYYELMSRALKDDGIICTQGECIWLHLKLICQMKEFCETIFPSVAYAYSTIPTYPSGQIGYMLCSLNGVSNSVQELFCKETAILHTVDIISIVFFYCTEINPGN